MKVNILYQFNNKYAPYAGVSITSLFENNREIEDLEVYILGENVSRKNILLLNETAQKYNRAITFFDTDNLISKMKVIGLPQYRGSYAANMRLFVDEFLDSSVERVLYFDSDTVINGNIYELYTMRFEGEYLAMTIDSLGKNHGKEIGLDKNTNYFNSGVILYDLTRWREEQVSDKIYNHIRQVRSNYPAPDQDLLNVVCQNHIKVMDLRYNFQPVHMVYDADQYIKVYKKSNYYTKTQILNAKSNPVIIHFFRYMGEFPWSKNNNHPDKEIYRKYLAISMFHDYNDLAENVSTLMKIERLLKRILPNSFFLYIFKISHMIYIHILNMKSKHTKEGKFCLKSLISIRNRL